MKFICLFFGIFISTLISFNKNEIVYVTNCYCNETVESIIRKCVVDDSDNVRFINIDTNYNTNVDIGQYYIEFDAIDESDNVSSLKINVIVIAPLEAELYDYVNSDLTIEQLLINNSIALEYIEIVEDEYTNNKNTVGTYNVKVKINLIDDYISTFKINVLEENYNLNNIIIYPLYNRLSETNIKELAAKSLNLSVSDIFSVKGAVDIYHSGRYKVNVMDVNNKIYRVDFIIKEMLPKRKVTSKEKMYLYLTIFFNLDDRYKTDQFFDFKTRVQYINEIYRSNYIRS